MPKKWPPDPTAQPDPQSAFVASHADAQLPGPRGQQGERGAQGAPWAPGLRRAVAALFIVMFALLGLGFWGLVHVVDMNNQTRCDSLKALIAIKIHRPIAGHESREYDAAVRAVNLHRAERLGCIRKGTP